MESMHDALLKRMGNYGLEKVLSASMIIGAANRVLPPKIRAKTYRDGTVTVEADTGTEAYFFKQEIETYIERINAALPNSVVKIVRIRTKHL